MDAQGIDIGGKWMVTGLAYLVFRLSKRVEALQAKLNEVCWKNDIEPLPPESQ